MHKKDPLAGDKWVLFVHPFRRKAHQGFDAVEESFFFCG